MNFQTTFWNLLPPKKMSNQIEIYCQNEFKIYSSGMKTPSDAGVLINLYFISYLKAWFNSFSISSSLI